MKALVLAGGKGTRLRPLTYTTAKQLIPIANRPIIHYVMDQISRVGIKDVGVIIAPETGHQIKEALADNPWGFDFSFILQEEPKGLAHAVKVAQEFLGDEPFLMYLGDNLIGQSIEAFVQEFGNSRPDALILLKEVEDPRMFGVAISEIKPSFRGELEITDAIQKLLDKGKTVKSFILERWWLDTGKKDDLLEANRVVLDELIARGLQGEIDEESKVAGRVSLAKGARVKKSTIRGPAVIGEGTIIENSFVGPYSSIGGGCVIKNSVLEHSVILDGAKVIDIERLEDSVIGKNAFIGKGQQNSRALRLMVGDDAEVLL